MAHQFKSRLRELYLKVETSHYYEYQKWIILQFSLDLSTSQKYGSVMNDPLYLICVDLMAIIPVISIAHGLTKYKQ